MSAQFASQMAPNDKVPVYTALQLTQGGTKAHIILNEQVYILRVTRAGKLILTK